MNILNNISPIMALSGLTIGLIVVVAVLLVAVIVLYFIGRKAEKKQAEQEKTMKENAQTVSLFVIDKKKLKLKDSGLPSIVLEQTPKYARRAKVPIVKVKAGPRVMNLIADAKISGACKALLSKREIETLTPRSSFELIAVVRFSRAE